MDNLQHKSQKNWYDRSYKWLLIAPALMILFSIIYLTMFYQQNGDVINKGVSLTGGTTITVFDKNADIEKVKLELGKELNGIEVRKLSDIRTNGQVGFFIETKDDSAKAKTALEEFLGYALDEKNSSIEFSSAGLSSGFYKQIRNSFFVAFSLMGCVVFLIFSRNNSFRSMALVLTGLSVKLLMPQVIQMYLLSLVMVMIGTVLGIIVVVRGKEKKMNTRLILISVLVSWVGFFFVGSEKLIFPGILLVFVNIIYIIDSIPSFAVIVSAFADILMTIVVVDIAGMNISSAGIIAFLMLIGYSVDTDILLTSRMLKNKEDSVNQRLFGAFKTGITMTLTAIASVAVSLAIIYGFSDTLRQIFTIILIGLGFDIFNTWVTNASLLKWYVERKEDKQ